MIDYTEHLTPFEEKAIYEIALAMFDHNAPRATLAAQIESTAALLNCTPTELIAGRVTSCIRGIQSHDRKLDTFDLPCIDIDAARAAFAKECSESASKR